MCYLPTGPQVAVVVTLVKIDVIAPNVCPISLFYRISTFVHFSQLFQGACALKKVVHSMVCQGTVVYH